MWESLFSLLLVVLTPEVEGDITVFPSDPVSRGMTVSCVHGFFQPVGGLAGIYQQDMLKN